LKIIDKSERGGYSILFAVIFGTGLLIVVFTIVLDGGNISSERRVLQNVAESGALALARECSTSPMSCASSSTPEQLAALNSPDQLTSVTEVCVRGVNRLLQPCQLPSTTKLDCAPLPTGTSTSYACERKLKPRKAARYLPSLETIQTINLMDALKRFGETRVRHQFSRHSRYPYANGHVWVLELTQ